jgi:hypothetical protein
VVAGYKVDSKYDEYMREGIEITVINIIKEMIKKSTGHVGTLFEYVVPKEHWRYKLKWGRETKQHETEQKR